MQARKIMAAAKRNRLMPWYVGGIVLLAAVIYTGYQMFVTGCQAPPIVQLIVLLIVPGIYLALMYLTLTSQE
jgi:hypothetical protein